MDFSSMNLPNLFKGNVSEDSENLADKFQIEDDEHDVGLSPRRLGRITGSQVKRISFVEKKADSDRKQDIIDWIVENNGLKELGELADKYGKDSYSKLTKAQIKELYNKMPGKLVLSKGATTYMKELIAQIKTGRYHYSGKFKATEWGHKYEPISLDLYEEKLGLHGYTFKRNEFTLSPFSNYVGCTADMNIYYPNGDCFRTVENKAPFNPANHESVIWDDEVDARYNDQTTLELICSNADSMAFISYHPNYPEEEEQIEVLVQREEMEKEMEELKARILRFCEIYKQKALERGIDLDKHFETVDADFKED